MIVDVVWLSLHEETPARDYWDQAMLEKLFRDMWRPARGRPFRNQIGFDYLEPGNGAIVIIPGQHHVKDVEAINELIRPLPWCLFIVAGDEDSLFPWEEIKHPRLNVWVMTPKPGREYSAARLIGEGPPPDAYEMLQAMPADRPQNLDWFFSGQITHSRREQMVDGLQELGLRDSTNGDLHETAGFTEGLGHELYYAQMASAKVIPCPAGPCTPDSFRFFEALEAGCIPIADNRTSRPLDQGDYWKMVFGDDLPFPVIDDWSQLPDLIETLLSDWKCHANRIFAWWQNYKRDLAYGLEAELDSLMGKESSPEVVDDYITVLIPTSPIPAHPDTSMIEETVASVRDRLPHSEIIIMIDGVRPEQEDRRSDYEEYSRRLLWKCNHEWSNVLPIVFEEHGHQGNVTRAALEKVKTPQILFVEHDTPLMGEIDWDDLTIAIATGEINMIRLLHESRILPDHEHLMIDSVEEPFMIKGVGSPFVRTIQWSQRPHLASTDFYRTIIGKYFGRESRTMIEDVMHGVVGNAGHRVGWEEFKLAIYAPDGHMQRSGNLDGRKDDPKFDMIFDYDGGDTPEWAPRRSPERDE